MRRALLVVALAALYAFAPDDVIMAAGAENLIGAGTQDRNWLPAGQSPASGITIGAAEFAATELPTDASRLRQDPRTGLWGIPVPRLGDPDFAPGNPRHTGEVPDGPLTLPAIVLAPDGRLDPSLPCILVTNGYGIAPGNSRRQELLVPLVERGYLGIEVSLREASRDPLGQQIGVNDYLRHYGADSVAIVNWIVKTYGCGMTDGQPGSARIGMLGASLLGVSQLQLLIHPELPAAVRAVVPAVADMAYNGFWFPGGMLPGPGRVARSGGEFRRMFPMHRDFDAFWAERQVTRRKLMAPASRGVALLMVGGWDDYITPGGIEAYEDYRSVSGRERKKLVISEAGHNTPMELYQPLAIQWMDYWLKGRQNGATDTRAAFFVRGPDRWRTESEWPIPDAVPVKLFLSAEKSPSLVGPNAGALQLRPGAKDRQFFVPYDPRTGPFLKTMISASATPPNTRRLQFDHSQDEARVASWTSAPLSAPIEMTGFPTLTLWAASSATDADFVVQLTDVAPDGYSKTVIAGYLNGPRQAYTDRNTASVTSPVPLEPGVPREFTIKLLPTSYVFPAGHRIRIAVAGGAEIGPGTDGQPQNAPQGPGRNPDAYDLTIYQGDKYPSALELPLVGEGAQILQKQ